MIFFDLDIIIELVIRKQAETQNFKLARTAVGVLGATKLTYRKRKGGKGNQK
jgi:hypothetical protein